MVARLRDDRLLRWSAYSTAPFLWLSLAFLNPFLLAMPALVYLGLSRAMAYGMLERRDPPDDPDLL